MRNICCVSVVIRSMLVIFQYIVTYLYITVNYLAIGLALFIYNSHSSTVDNGDPNAQSSTAALLARGSYACMYLIGAMTSLVESAGIASELLGYGNRIVELLLNLERAEIDKCKMNKRMGSMNVESNHASQLHAKSISMDIISWIQSFWMTTSASQSYDVVFNEHDYEAPLVSDSRMICKDPVGQRVPVSYQAKQLNSSEGCRLEFDLNLFNLLLICIEFYRLVLEINRVSIVTPGLNFRVLVPCLSLQLYSGMRILITGKSGCGKSSLLRVIGGIWPAMQSISTSLLSSHQLSSSFQIFAQSSAVHFLPQSPYCFEVCLFIFVAPLFILVLCVM